MSSAEGKSKLLGETINCFFLNTRHLILDTLPFDTRFLSLDTLISSPSTLAPSSLFFASRQIKIKRYPFIRIVFSPDVAAV